MFSRSVLAMLRTLPALDNFQFVSSWPSVIMVPRLTSYAGVLVMSHMRTTLPAVFSSLVLLGLIASPSFAEEKSFYSPVIRIDTESQRILISTYGSVFWIDVPDAAKPHIEKLPISGLADFVVEMRENGQAPLLKTWKVKSGETSCTYFDGKTCK
jgi:hypothetical protein